MSFDLRLPPWPPGIGLGEAGPALSGPGYALPAGRPWSASVGGSASAVAEAPALPEARGILDVTQGGRSGAPRGRVDLEGVTVRFGKDGQGHAAVEDVSFTMAPGEFVALLGPSGCGKSTLLNAIAGFRKPDAGTVRLDGRPVTGPGRRAAVVFQQHGLFPWMTALGNVAFGPRRAGHADALERARHYLELVGLAGHGGKYPFQLSGGQQQRVGLARALINRPDILLLDEPFGALDALTRGLMQELLLSLWERDRHTTLFITHDVEEAVFLADRVGVMGSRPGRIRAWIEVPLPRPRRAGTRSEPAFLRLRQEALGLVREESLKAFRPEAP